MSMLDQLEENLEAAIARQRAGRVTREACIDAMGIAIVRADRLANESANADGEKWDTWDIGASPRERLEAALDAAIASGYVVRP